MPQYSIGPYCPNLVINVLYKVYILLYLVTYHLFEADVSGNYRMIRPVSASGQLCDAVAQNNLDVLVDEAGFDFRR